MGIVTAAVVAWLAALTWSRVDESLGEADGWPSEGLGGCERGVANSMRGFGVGASTAVADRGPAAQASGV